MKFFYVGNVGAKLWRTLQQRQDQKWKYSLTQIHWFGTFTCARNILWVVGDKLICIESGIPFLKNFVEYISKKRYHVINNPSTNLLSSHEKRLFELLRGLGYDPKSQYPAGSYRIDIALQSNGKKLAIVLDGQRWHSTLSGERLERYIVRGRNLRKMCWLVMRF